jgi:ribosome biogenesis protein ENP2
LTGLHEGTSTINPTVPLFFLFSSGGSVRSLRVSAAGLTDFGMQVSDFSGKKIYSLSGDKSVPIATYIKQKAQSKRTKPGSNGIELIQDLEMPTASQKIKMSPDEAYLALSGTYPPQLRLFELAQLSMKVDRRVDCEIVQFQVGIRDTEYCALLTGLSF